MGSTTKANSVESSRERCMWFRSGTVSFDRIERGKRSISIASMDEQQDFSTRWTARLSRVFRLLAAGSFLSPLRGLIVVHERTDDLRRGLHSFAASRLGWDLDAALEGPLFHVTYRVGAGAYVSNRLTMQRAVRAEGPPSRRRRGKGGATQTSARHGPSTSRRMTGVCVHRRTAGGGCPHRSPSLPCGVFSITWMCGWDHGGLMRGFFILKYLPKNWGGM